MKEPALYCITKLDKMWQNLDTFSRENVPTKIYAKYFTGCKNPFILTCISPKLRAACLTVA